MEDFLKHEDSDIPSASGKSQRWIDEDSTKSIVRTDIDSVVNPLILISEPVKGEETWVDVVLSNVIRLPKSKIKFIPLINETDGLITNSNNYSFAVPEWIKKNFRERNVNGIVSYVGTPDIVSSDTISSIQKFDKDEVLDSTSFDQLAYWLRLAAMDIRRRLASAILLDKSDFDKSAIHSIVRHDNSGNIITGTHIRTLESSDLGSPVALRDAILRKTLEAKMSMGTTFAFCSVDYYMSLLGTMTAANGTEPYFRSVSSLDNFFGIKFIPVPDMSDIVEGSGEDAETVYDSPSIIVTDLSKYTLGATMENTVDKAYDIDYNKSTVQMSGRYCGLPTGLLTTIVG